MEEFPPKFSTVLVTPDPHYIPGYAGYCPQLKFHLGETYGQLTAKLLTSPDMMTHSDRLVLHTGRFPSTEEDTGPRDEIWRSFHHGGQRSVQSVIPPGYTGFVPKSQNYFAHTYAETCRRALTEFQRDQEARAHLQSKDLPVLSSHAEFQAQVPSTPLRAITTQPFSYKAESQKDMGSPYFMDDTSPHKYFISGFTGYVPKARFLIGTSYPITTNKALIHFGRQFRGEPTTSLNIPGEICTLPPIPTVYSSTQGLMPSYTGHVPGYKFRYGHTFGQLTHNTLGMGDARRKIEGRS